MFPAQRERGEAVRLLTHRPPGRSCEVGGKPFPVTNRKLSFEGVTWQRPRAGKGWTLGPRTEPRSSKPAWAQGSHGRASWEPPPEPLPVAGARFHVHRVCLPFLAVVEWTVSPAPKSNVQVLVPSISECDFIWPQGLNSGRVKMGSLGGTLVQCDRCPYRKGKSRHRRAHREKSRDYEATRG